MKDVNAQLIKDKESAIKKTIADIEKKASDIRKKSFKKNGLRSC